MLTGRKQLYFLLDCIKDRSEVTPSDEPITINRVANLNKKYSQEDLIGLFTKLEREAKVIEIIEMPKRMDGYLTDGHSDFVIKLLPSFDDYYFQIQNEPGYFEFTGKEALPTVDVQTSDSEKVEKLYREIADVDEQIRIRRQALANAQGTINNNPHYSEATRVGQLAKLEQQAQTDIGNFIKQKESYLEEIKLRQGQSETHTKQSKPSVMEELSKLENLSEDNFQNVFNVLIAIENTLQLHQSKRLTIDFTSSPSELEGYDKSDLNDLNNYYYRAFTYLKNIGCIESYTKDFNALFSDIVLNPDKFYDTLREAKEIKKRFQDKQAKNSITDNTENAAYKITFTPKREILLNNHFLLSKLDFDSENEVVFSFLYANPNNKHSQEQIEKAVGRKLTKSLHKIVENLGFTGDLKAMFIDTSKNSIRFRNPITKNDLNELGLTYIKLPK